MVCTVSQNIVANLYAYYHVGIIVKFYDLRRKIADEIDSHTYVIQSICWVNALKCYADAKI